MLETETEVLIFFALPGVDPESVDAVIEGGTLLVSGKRVLPEELRTALIHQLELPQGQFARRVLASPEPLQLGEKAGDQRLLAHQPSKIGLSQGRAHGKSKYRPRAGSGGAGQRNHRLQRRRLEHPFDPARAGDRAVSRRSVPDLHRASGFDRRCPESNARGAPDRHSHAARRRGLRSPRAPTCIASAPSPISCAT